MDAKSVLETIKSKIETNLKVEKFELTDNSGGTAQKLHLLLVADEFDGMSLLERHRKVYDILSEEMKDIHALAIKAYSSSEYAKIKAPES